MEDPSPAASAGYSGTPLHRKLGVKPGHRVLAVRAPIDWDVGRLDPDAGATVHRRAAQGPGYDVVLLFASGVNELQRRLPAALSRTVAAGRCWVAWQKKQPGRTGMPTDLTENGVRRAGLAAGWVDVKVCAVDDVWSGLCLVRRLADR